MIHRPVDQTPADSGEKWVLIQLARFGDVAQTAAVVAGINELAPAPVVHLVVESSVAPLAERIVGVDRVFSLPRHKLLMELDNPNPSWIGRMKGLDSLTRELQSERYTKSVNLTHTPESAYLSAMIGAASHAGLRGDRRGAVAHGGCERYFQAILSRRECSHVHLNDLHLALAGVPHPRSAGNLNTDGIEMGRLSGLMRLKATGPLPLLAVQLGANERLRQWPVENFIAVAQSLLQMRRVMFLLVGSKSESELARGFSAAFPGNCIDLTGETNLLELAAALSHSDAVIGGDTGTVHLAAALGIPTVSIFLGEARPEETASYGEGHIAFKLSAALPSFDNKGGRCEGQSDLESCGNNTRSLVEAVALAILAQIDGRSFHTAPIHGATIYTTSFDRDGTLNFSDITGAYNHARRNALRALWKDDFLGTPADDDFDADLSPRPTDEADALARLAELAHRAHDAMIGMASDADAPASRNLFGSISKRIAEFHRNPDAAGMLADIYLQELAAAARKAPDGSFSALSALNELQRRATRLANRMSHRRPDALTGDATAVPRRQPADGNRA